MLLNKSLDSLTDVAITVKCCLFGIGVSIENFHKKCYNLYMSEQSIAETPRPNVPEITLQNELSSALAYAIDQYDFGVIYNDSFAIRGNMLDSAAQIAETLLPYSPQLMQGLESIREGEAVVLKIAGLPVDTEIGPPPEDGATPVGKKQFRSEACALMFGSIIGQPSIIAGEKREALVHQITPVKGREETQSNEGAVILKFHQDLSPVRDLKTLPYDRFMPDWLILTGVQKGAGTTETYISVVEDAVKLLEPETVDILLERRFVTDPPDSFKKEGAQQGVEVPRHPVLNVFKDHIEAAYDSSSNLRPIDPNDLEAAEALAKLETAFQAVTQVVLIEPGMSVIFNNRRVVHGRGAVNIEQHDQPENRWIQRLYVMDPVRVVNQSLGKPWNISLGGGYLAISSSSEPSERIMQLAGLDKAS
jgi:alpha-ketoglutarate-dependent taurine dioxygenase